MTSCGAFDGEIFERLLAGVIGDRLMSPLVADFGNDGNHCGIVVDDENSGHGWGFAGLRVLQD